MARYIARPKNQRDPQALHDFLQFGKWERHGWGDYNGQVADAAREVATDAKIGTYHRTWMSPGAATGAMNGYPPDVFEKLDIISHVHYADNSTGWVHSSMVASALRFGRRRPVWVNIPLSHEAWRGRGNGEYQRHMAFAMLQQGADGISFWGLAHDFRNAPNLETMMGKETTKHLNSEILAPFGELVSRTDPGYRNVGIVYTLNQMLLSEFKQIGVSNQAEELWVACWRLGYPAAFLYEDAFEQSLSQFKLIFVPGIRFENELEPQVMKRLEEAIRAGCKVVVERGSELNIPGVIRLDDLSLQDFYIRNYFPTWLDDELNKIYEKSQAATDYLARKLPELGIEPAARGEFKVGPNWRQSGELNYLVMANFEDPDYGYAVKQIMAKPVKMKLSVPSHRGAVAYDLLSQKQMPMARQGDDAALELDMTRVQGAFVAFLPDAVGKLQAAAEVSPDNRRLRLSCELIGASGKAIKGVFPTRLRLLDGKGQVLHEFFRTLGGQLQFELNLPAVESERGRLALEVRESISGQTVRVPLASPAIAAGAVRFVDDSQPSVPYPAEVRRFMASTKNARLVATDRIPGLDALAKELAAALRARGITAAITPEASAYRFPFGDQDLPDPMNDGFHSWRGGAEIIQPATVVDSPVILMAGKSSSYLLEGLAANGFLTELPAGGPLVPARTSIQVAPAGLHYGFDTLCLIANDAAGMRQAIDALLKGLPDRQQAAVQAYSERKLFTSQSATQVAAAVEFMGSNEYVLDVEFDRAGNAYAITWGHGNNLYSFDPAGNVRFSRQLPEAAASRLEVFDDRVCVFTSAGSRLYQLALDGSPISQVRLTMDPGPVGDDEYSLSYAQYEYVPATKRVLQNICDMRFFDENGKPVVQWSGEEYIDKNVSDKAMRRRPGAFAFSHDGSRIAQTEISSYFTQSGYEDVEVFDTHLVMRGLHGKLLAEYKNVANESSTGGGPSARLLWNAESPGPAVIVKGEKWQFDAGLNLLHTRAYDPGMLQLGGERRLVRDGNSLRYVEGERSETCRLGPFDVMPSLAALSPDGRLLGLLDEYGLLGVFEAATGKPMHAFTVLQLGHVLRFGPDSASVYIGGVRGLLARYDLQGKPLWQTSLAQFNTTIERPLLYDPSFPDLTPALWPEMHDAPGQLEAMVKMGEDRLANGNCESDGGWQVASGDVAYYGEGHAGGRSLKVGQMLVSQEVSKYLGNHVTWVLEFHYKAAAPADGAAPLLTSGLLASGRITASVARKFSAGKGWRFARVVIKSGAKCEALKVGFRASGGEVLVDSITLRQIRFPSINYLFYEPLHEIEPVVLTNPLFSESYDPIGNVRMEAPGQVTVPPYGSGGKPLLEPCFLQNARLNEIGSFWYEMPPVRGAFPITLTLQEPRCVSQIALYFNVYDEANVTPHFDVYVTDLEEKKDILVASVRNNRQLFRLIKFQPIKTPSVRLELVNSIRRLRTVTEIELYGPLSGKDVAAGFSDPDGQNTWMGSFARVDKRPKTLAPELSANMKSLHDPELVWSVPCSQALAADGRLFLTRSMGHSEMWQLNDLAAAKSRTRSGGIGFSPHVSLYGGLLLKCGINGRLYCIDADSSRELWSVKLVPDADPQPLRGGPVAIEEDIFAANQSGKLYKLDLANGSIMMEIDISGGVYGALATDGRSIFMITDDGFVQAFEASSGRRLWGVPVAPYTDSTPAVDGNTVYLADQKGEAKAVDAATGNVIWTASLGQEFTRCPVVTDRWVVFGCRDGKLAILNRSDGREVRSFQVRSRFAYEPMVFGDELLYFEDALAKLANAADGSIKDVQAYCPKGKEFELANISLGDDPLVSLSYYRGTIIAVPRHNNYAHGTQEMNTVWSPGGGRLCIISPREKPAEKEAKP